MIIVNNELITRLIMEKIYYLIKNKLANLLLLNLGNVTVLII